MNGGGVTREGHDNPDGSDDNNIDNNNNDENENSDNSSSSSSSSPSPTSLQVSTVSGRLTLLPPLVLQNGLMLLLPTRNKIRIIAKDIVYETRIGSSYNVMKESDNDNDNKNNHRNDDDEKIIAWCTTNSSGSSNNNNNNHNSSLVILGYQSGMIQIFKVDRSRMEHQMTIPMPEANGELMDVSTCVMVSAEPTTRRRTNHPITTATTTTEEEEPLYPDILALIKVEHTLSSSTSLSTIEDEPYDNTTTSLVIPQSPQYNVYRYQSLTTFSWTKIWTIQPKNNHHQEILTGRWVRSLDTTSFLVAGDSFLRILRYYEKDKKKNKDGTSSSSSSMTEHCLPCRRADGPITCIAISSSSFNNNAAMDTTNGTTTTTVSYVAAGFANGSIRVYHTTTFHDRRLHWHAHPVRAMAFGSHHPNEDGILHSVGEESVWIQWDPVNDRPRNMLPRIAPTGIDSIVPMVGMDNATTETTTNNTMLLYADNTIFLYDCISLQLQWKYQGIHGQAKIHGILGNTTTKPPRHKNHHPSSLSSSKLVLSGSPGMLHIFASDRVQRTWRVAPYNRVSRIDDRAQEIPPPRLLHVHQSTTTVSHIDMDDDEEKDDDGTTWWLTIHETYYESRPPNVILQFWDAPNHRVSCMVQTETILACGFQMPNAVLLTKSDIQLWDIPSHSNNNNNNNKSSEELVPSCRTRIPIPAGFANQTIRSNPIYSDDGSILAIAFGRYITLWNPSTVRLLTTIPMLEEIEQMAFVMDSFVVRTQVDVSCISILGNDQYWQYDIEATAMATTRDTVVVGNADCVMVFDAVTGEVSFSVKHNHGAITSMHVSYERNHPLCIMATTQHGELLEIKDISMMASHTKDQGARTKQRGNAIKTAPTLPAFYHANSKKRQGMEISDLDEWCPSQMTPIENLADDELPLLRGEFVMAFLGRNLRRKPLEA